MAVNDRTRLDLHRKLEALLGPEEADTLMAHLPPTTWQDIATKDDLRVLGAEFRTEIAGVRDEISQGDGTPDPVDGHVQHGPRRPRPHGGPAALIGSRRRAPAIPHARAPGRRADHPIDPAARAEGPSAGFRR